MSSNHLHTSSTDQSDSSWIWHSLDEALVSVDGALGGAVADAEATAEDGALSG